MGCHALLQGIYSIQGLNPSLLCLLHCQVGSLPLTAVLTYIYIYIYIYICVCVCVYIHTYIHIHMCSVTQSCPTLCNPMDCSPPGSSVHGVFQVKLLECVAISYFYIFIFIYIFIYIFIFYLYTTLYQSIDTIFDSVMWLYFKSNCCCLAIQYV